LLVKIHSYMFRSYTTIFREYLKCFLKVAKSIYYLLWRHVCGGHVPGVAKQHLAHREIIAVCSQIQTKHINTLCGQNVELLNVKLVVYMVITVRYI